MNKYFLLYLFFAFVSCNKSQVDEDTMFGVTWKISYYYDATDQTASYTTYYFMFNEDGTLMAHEGSKLTIGRWSESNGRFTILFETNPTLLKLKKDWLIVEKSASVIKLKDDSSTSNAELYFLKQ
jgi:hypothetical protein